MNPHAVGGLLYAALVMVIGLTTCVLALKGKSRQ
jgi:hypothetical protein